MLVGKVELVKLASILLVSMVLVAIAGCGGGESPAPAATSPSQSALERSTGTSTPSSSAKQAPSAGPTSAPNASSQAAVVSTATPATVAVHNTPVPVTQPDNFRLLISDEQNAIGDFVHLWVEIDRVGLQQGGESGAWREFEVPEEHRRVDLTTVIGDAAVEIVRTYIPEGHYGKVFIHVSEVRGELRSGDSTPVKLPSNKLQIVKPFEVRADSLSSFVFDITVIAAGNQRSEVKYVLQPVISESGADQRVKIEDGEHSIGDDTEEITEDVEAVEDEEETELSQAENDGAEPSLDPDPSPDPLSEELFLVLLSPQEDTVFVNSPTVSLSGLTVIDAVVSVNDDLVEVDAEGRFEAVASLEEGPNLIEVVVSSTATGEEKSVVLMVFYLPEEDQES